MTASIIHKFKYMNVGMNYKHYPSFVQYTYHLLLFRNLYETKDNIQLFCIFNHINGKYKGNKH